MSQVLPPVFAYWRELGSRHVTALCTRSRSAARCFRRPSEEDLEELAAAAPMMPGAEYLTAELLRALWDEIGEAFSTEHAASIAFQPLPNDDPVQRQPDIPLAQVHLDWAPRVDLEEGLMKTIAYFEKLL